MIYVIVKQGVYRHGIFGVHDDLVVAEGIAKLLAKNDIDAHHSYDVVETDRNSAPRIRIDEDFGYESSSDKVVFSVNKDGILRECDE